MLLDREAGARSRLGSDLGGRRRSNERFDGEVLDLYRLRDGKLARAQMFYFDAVQVVSFLSDATG
jgi:ketosteroid isomerase-like protein